jgi:hypothetical protein
MAEQNPFPRNTRYRIQRSLLQWFGWMDPGSGLQREVLERQALRIAGASEFLDTSFREPLDRFLASVRSGNRLNSVGRYLTAFCLRNSLVNRLSLEQVWGGPRPVWPAGPWPAKPPLYIVGMPRTGTTMLHRLLAADPAGRPLMFWESYSPVRTPQRSAAPHSEVARQQMAVKAVDLLYRNAPYLKEIHEVEALGPEECYYLLANTFVSYSFPLQWSCPEYLEWLGQRTEADWIEVYRHYLATLRTLEGKGTDRHWVLKCPLHAPRLGVLRSLVPSAVCVQTYRDVREIVGSLCSLNAALISMGTDRLDMKAIGRDALRTLAMQARASVEASIQYPESVVFVHYKSLVKDPLTTVRAIYERAGLQLTPQAEAAMKTWLASHPQGRHGRHQYSLADFGLTEREVLDAFGEYMEVERRLAPA